MPATTRQSVVSHAPELASVPEDDARWALFIADAELELAPSVWGRRLELGARLLVAHRMTLSLQSATGRAGVVSEAAAGVSRTYATPRGGTGDVESTPYGLEYRRLARLVGGIGR